MMEEINNNRKVMYLLWQNQYLTTEMNNVIHGFRNYRVFQPSSALSCLTLLNLSFADID